MLTQQEQVWHQQRGSTYAHMRLPKKCVKSKARWHTTHTASDVEGMKGSIATGMSAVMAIF